MGTFQGLELSKRALYAQQGALYTTGHNIANVNTEGYSRQRVNFETSTPFPVPSRVMPQIPGQLGTGVDIGVVERIRSKFLDMQFRSENSRHEYWDTKQETLGRLESLLNEPSDSGLTKTMDQFWQSLQDLAANPDNDGARSVVAQRGLAVAETFNHLSKSMQSIQGDIKEQIDGSVKDINSLLKNINKLNEQIQSIEPHGLLANDLYDERDRLIDSLSEQVNIKVTYSESSKSALDIADGIASIELLDESGRSIGEDGVYLIEVTDDKPLSESVNELSVEYEESEDESSVFDTPPVTGIKVAGYEEELEGVELLESVGRLSALIESYGYKEDGQEDVIGTYPEVLAELDKMAREFAEAFNTIHNEGNDADGNSGGDFFVGKDNFDGITAESITVDKDILKDPNLIAAADPERGEQNGDNALKLADVFDDKIEGLDKTSPRKFFTALIGDLAVQTEEAIRMTKNTAQLQQQVDHSRQSTSAVSLDEEIANLVKLQHAYNASARNMTVIDETIDRIINHMGVVGR